MLLKGIAALASFGVIVVLAVVGCMLFSGSAVLMAQAGHWGRAAFALLLAGCCFTALRQCWKVIRS